MKKIGISEKVEQELYKKVFRVEKWYFENQFNYDGRKTKLEDVLKSLEKDYGKGAVLHGHVPSSEVEVIDTGSIGLNSAIGVGGVPVGKIIEIFGWESSGKALFVKQS